MKKWKLIFYCVFALSLVLFLAPVASGAPGKWGLDKLAHFFIFGVLLISGFKAFANSRRQTLLWLIAYAPLIELFQYYFFFYRSFDLRDIVFDLAGLILGYVVYKLK